MSCVSKYRGSHITKKLFIVLVLISYIQIFIKKALLVVLEVRVFSKASSNSSLGLWFVSMHSLVVKMAVFNLSCCVFCYRRNFINIKKRCIVFYKSFCVWSWLCLLLRFCVLLCFYWWSIWFIKEFITTRSRNISFIISPRRNLLKVKQNLDAITYKAVSLGLPNIPLTTKVDIFVGVLFSFNNVH